MGSQQIEGGGSGARIAVVVERSRNPVYALQSGLLHRHARRACRRLDNLIRAGVATRWVLRKVSGYPSSFSRLRLRTPNIGRTLRQIIRQAATGATFPAFGVDFSPVIWGTEAVLRAVDRAGRIRVEALLGQTPIGAVDHLLSMRRLSEHWSNDEPGGHRIPADYRRAAPG